jgi:hypothetical protein
MKEDEIEEETKCVSDKIAIPFIIIGILVSGYCFSALYGILLGLYDVVKILNIE